MYRKMRSETGDSKLSMNGDIKQRESFNKNDGARSHIMLSININEEEDDDFDV